MKTKSIVFLFIVLSIYSIACKKEKTQQFEVTGIIQIRGITTYQYGTHTISNNNAFYALKSDKYKLDDYVNQTITITGETISGYPLNGGPYFLNVIEVK